MTIQGSVTSVGTRRFPAAGHVPEAAATVASEARNSAGNSRCVAIAETRIFSTTAAELRPQPGDNAVNLPGSGLIARAEHVGESRPRR